MNIARAALVVTALTIGSACASDGDAESARGAATVDSTPVDSVGDRPCVDVNPDLASVADTIVPMVLTDFRFDRDTYTVPAGVITFDAVNSGGVDHEVAFLPGGGDVPMVDGRPDEAALESAGAFELEAFGPDRSCTATYRLEPGTYTLFCIVPLDDGRTHYHEGMRATLIVT